MSGIVGKSPLLGPSRGQVSEKQDDFVLGRAQVMRELARFEGIKVEEAPGEGESGKLAQTLQIVVLQTWVGKIDVVPLHVWSEHSPHRASHSIQQNAMVVRLAVVIAIVNEDLRLGNVQSPRAFFKS